MAAILPSPLRAFVDAVAFFLVGGFDFSVVVEGSPFEAPAAVFGADLL